MKTTIELPDDLVKQLKLRALIDGRKLKDTVADVLRRGLEAPVKQPRESKESPLSIDVVTGLPVIRCRHGAKVGEEMTPERVAAILLQQEVARDHDAR